MVIGPDAPGVPTNVKLDTGTVAPVGKSTEPCGTTVGEVPGNKFAIAVVRPWPGLFGDINILYTKYTPAASKPNVAMLTTSMGFFRRRVTFYS
jgi:hypothetical protein